MALTDLKKEVGQYLDWMTESSGEPEPILPFGREWNVDRRGYPPTDWRGRTIDYEETSQTINNPQPDMLAAAADVVLFEIGGKKLLFAGDAQGGNWEYWLFKMDKPMKDPTKIGDIIEPSKELLQTIDVYKVGHHGSTNATPIQVVAAATARPESSNGFISMCSTEDGVYGDPDKDTEVPRRLLMEVLDKGGCLIRSDSFPITITNPTNKVIKSREGLKLPEPKIGEVKIANLYIEYSF